MIGFGWKPCDNCDNHFGDVSEPSLASSYCPECKDYRKQFTEVKKTAKVEFIDAPNPQFVYTFNELEYPRTVTKPPPEVSVFYVGRGTSDRITSLTDRNDAARAHYEHLMKWRCFEFEVVESFDNVAAASYYERVLIEALQPKFNQQFWKP